MKVIYSQLPSKRRKCVATIGVFDGIHLGHQLIFKKLKEESKKSRLCSLVITFDIPPHHFLRKNLLFTRLDSKQLRGLTGHEPQKNFSGCITDRKDKIDFMGSYGIDYVWILKTKPSLLNLSAEEFLSYSSKYFEIKEIVVGEDFRFGRKAEADLKHLKKLGRLYNFDLVVVRKKVKNKKIISSSLIRKFIETGKLREAKEILGREFSLKGKVQRGRKLGRRLGFPTANISTFDYIIPSTGVYAAFTVLRKKIYLAAVNVGVKPTTGKLTKKSIEAHIIGFGGDILGETVKIVFLEKIREEQKFFSLKRLSNAIRKDICLITSRYSIRPSKNTQLIVL